MADPAAPTTSRSSRSGSKEPRTATAVSTDTENKLARAARSAQRLAELSDVPADDSTLDLFPDDPTRAALQAMNIDVRQRTLSGFELPDEVLAVVEAVAEESSAPAAAADPKAARRTSRAAQADDAVRAAQTERTERTEQAETTPAEAARKSSAQKPARSVSDVEPKIAATTAAEPDVPQAQTKAESHGAAQGVPGPAASSAVTPPVAAASTRRNTAAAGNAARDDRAASPDSTAETTPQRADASDEVSFAASLAQPTSASERAGAETSAAAVARAAEPQRQPYTAPAGAPLASAFGTPGGAAAKPQAAPRATPQLEHARAAAFADTVDALYGVIADQRRAAAGHSRSMQRMLSIVVGALLVAVVIGVVQMVLLVRLTRDTTVQQQRIEQTLMSQQATLATLLQTEPSAPAAAPAVPTAPGAPAANAGAPAAVAPRQSTEARSPAKTQHAHKHKPAATQTH
ncbi:hypothetical protein [Paraburkholderia solisilvae]|uniref:Uncharacterized protein n=1 Tax=Paraburkholderia solisilvae TaxID=624376 RepID=A0A6J5E3X4_9BURK|nr:hypothetical protein [Paraburkholderia solisilvae]CAB3761168.1 hypothetical protein LMG29739_03567 [Paraburkholderia solisilvae]